jgi:hypothetical protein
MTIARRVAPSAVAASARPHKRSCTPRKVKRLGRLEAALGLGIAKHVRRDPGQFGHGGVGPAAAVKEAVNFVHDLAQGAQGGQLAGDPPQGAGRKRDAANT